VETKMFNICQMFNVLLAAMFILNTSLWGRWWCFWILLC